MLKFNIPLPLWYKKYVAAHFVTAHNQGEEHISMNQILAAVAKAVLVTLVSTVAAIVVDQIRRYNESRDDGFYHPDQDEYERW